MSKKGFADAELSEQYKRVELVTSFLEGLKPKVTEKLKGSQASIDRGKAFADCLTAAASSTKGVDSSELGTSTVALCSETARLLKLFEVLQANFTAQLGVDVDVPLDRFLNSELQTVKIYKRKYEEANASLEAAVNKLTQIKLNPKLRLDATKLAEAENESTRCKEQFEIAKESAAVVMNDVLALYHVQLSQMLIGTVDAAAEFFARGHQQFSEYRSKLEPVRQQISRKRQEYYGQPRQPRDPDVVKSGVLEKRNKQGKFAPRSFTLKWRYLMAFDKDDATKLRSVVQLRGTLLVTEAPAQKRPYCISIKLPGKEWILAAPSKHEQDAWIVAISDCIDRKAADRKGASFIELPPLSPHSSSMADAWTHKGGSRIFVSAAADPKKDLFKQLMLEERSYVQQLSAVVNAYLYPLRDGDSALMKEIGVADEGAIFSHAEQLLNHHREMLKQMQVLLDSWPEQSVGQFFVDHAHVLQLYIPYIENFSNAVFLLTRARKNSKTLEQFFKKCQAASANEGGEELELLLSHPLNRITQYKRFFTQLVGMSNPNEAGHRSIEEAASLISELCASVTQSNKSASDLAALIAVSKKVESYDGDLVVLGRRYVKETGLVLTADGAKNDVWAILLNDQLLCTKKQSGLLKDRFKLLSITPLLKAHVSDVPDEPFSFQLAEPAPSTRVLQFTASSVQERQEWCMLLTSCINEQSSRHFFGVPLPELMANKRQKGHDIPVFVEKATAFLSNHINAEGLFRLSGQGSIVEQYRAALDGGQEVEFDSATDPHVVTGLLKMWFRELPEPILTWDLYDPFVQALAEKNEFNRLTYVRTLMLQLPPTNRYVLQHLFKFLRQVAANHTVNKMASKNLSIVFGPNMLRKRKGNDPAPEATMNMLNESSESYEVLTIFIDHYDAVFEEIERDRMERLALLKEETQREEAAARKGADKPARSRLSANVPAQRVEHSGEEWKEGDISKQGWLEKKNPDAKDKKSKWEPRYFVLRLKYLVYYVQPTDPQPAGKIRLSNSAIESSTRKGYCITIKTPLEKVVLAAKSDVEKGEWLNLLLARRGELNPAVAPREPTNVPLGRQGRSASFVGPPPNNSIAVSNSPPKPVQLVATPTAEALPTYVKARMTIASTTLTNVAGSPPPAAPAPAAAPKPDSFARRASGLLQRTVSFTSSLRTSAPGATTTTPDTLQKAATGNHTDRDAKREAIARKGPAPPPPSASPPTEPRP